MHYFSTAIVLLCLLMFGSCPVLAAANFVGVPVQSVDGQKLLQVYAHRGARSFAPENSMPGYRTGLAIGTNWVDMEIVMTKDGEIVVSHDIWLNPDIVRNSDGKFLAENKAAFIKGVSANKLTQFLQPYLVKNLTLTQVEKYDVGRLNPGSAYAKLFPSQFGMDGVKMPTLREVIRYVNKVTKGAVGFQIEFKTDPEHPDWTYTPAEFAQALYKILREEGITRNCEVQSFDWRCLYELQKCDSKIATAYLTEWDNEPGTPYSFFDSNPAIAGLWTGGKLIKNYGNSMPQMIKALGGACWEPEDAELTKPALDEAHKLGLKVVVWTWPEHIGTTFDVLLIEKLIDWGVDGIITDDPGQLISMLAARGYAIPKRYTTSYSGKH